MKHLAAFLLAVALGFGVAHYAQVAQAFNPFPSPGEPGPDLYECCGYTGLQMQGFNPLSQQLIHTTNRTINYRWQVVAGCNAGNMHETLAMAIRDSSFLGITFIETDTNYQLTIRANCGTAFVNLCGAGAAACLGRGFPTTNDIDASTVMASYYDQSQESIWLHELFGHALTTANEGYCKGSETSGSCAGQPQFAPAPGYVSYMNTGTSSRVIWPQSDRDRFCRTMYCSPAIDLSAPPPCTPVTVGFDDCEGVWKYADRWTWNPKTAIWHDPRGVDYGACNGDRLRWSDAFKRWKIPGANDGFDPAFGAFAIVPAC